jgi:hypothetical protein
MDDGVHSLHATLHEGSIADGSEVIREGRLLHVNAPYGRARRSQLPRKRLAQVPGASRDQNSHHDDPIR